jgi:hypothetical protein
MLREIRLSSQLANLEGNQFINYIVHKARPNLMPSILLHVSLVNLATRCHKQMRSMQFHSKLRSRNKVVYIHLLYT